MIHNLSEHDSIVSSILSEIRDQDSHGDRFKFRLNLERIGELIAYEISKTLEFESVDIKTPLASTTGRKLKEQPVLATVLRAGLPFHTGFLRIFEKADNGFVYAFRKHHQDDTFDILEGYITCPNIDQRTVILADPMLASGASLISAIEQMKQFGKPKRLIFAALIAAEPGIKKVIEKFPDLEIWTAAIDPELDSKSYIVPGLGDAGDLAFGEKSQR